ncbi:MAG: methyltransferase [Rhodospirillaceae bacterium]|nr:methyltransferase [Rhodospirillaceae bacterium]
MTADAADTDDRLLGGRVVLRQSASGFRVSVDTVLLAAAVELAPGARALDVGCGTGGATLCLASRIADVALLGIDREADMTAGLRANATANSVEDRVTGETVDVAGGVPSHLRGAFDHVFSNPPYLPPGRADTREVDAPRRRATIESVPFDVWLSFMAACCTPKGSVTVIHRADRLEEILAAFEGLNGALRVVPIWPRAGQPARRVIVSARLGVRSPTSLCAGLALHDAAGGYTSAARRLLEDGMALSAVNAAG